MHLNGPVQAGYFGYRIKVLQPAALQIGNIGVSWNPTAESPMVHRITVHRDGAAIDVLKDARFEVLRREDQLEAAHLDGNLTAVLRIPDLRVGDELEVEITSFERDPATGAFHSGLMTLPASPPPGRFKLALSWEDGGKPTLKTTPDMAAVMEAEERRIDFVFDNPTTLVPLKGAPARHDWQRTVEFSAFSDWQSVSRHFAPLYARAARLRANSPLRREASQIAANHASAMARAQAALKLVQRDVRYIYVGLNGGNLIPASADETWQRRYGDCKGKTALLLALLNELGIAAEPVIINSNGGDDGFEQRLPTPRLFDHVLVRATIDGKVWWLDGTLPPVAMPSARLVFPSSRVLPLRAAGADLESLPPEPLTTPVRLTMHELDASAGFDKPAKITTTTILRGLKGLQQQVEFSAVTSDQLLAGFRQTATGEFWQTIDDVKWRYDERAGASIVTVSGTGMIDWENDGDGARSYALPGGGFSPPEKRLRPADQRQDAPWYSAPDFECDLTTVRLPLSTKPEQWSAKAGYDQRYFGRTYYRAWEMRDGVIRMVRGFRVDHEEIGNDDAVRDNARIAAFDNSKAYIFFDPVHPAGAVGKGERVPAPWELDWTAANVPCLPAGR